MAIDSARTTDLVEVIEQGLDVDGPRWALILVDMLAPWLFDHDASCDPG